MVKGDDNLAQTLNLAVDSQNGSDLKKHLLGSVFQIDAYVQNPEKGMQSQTTTKIIGPKIIFPGRAETGIIVNNTTKETKV